MHNPEIEFTLSEHRDARFRLPIPQDWEMDTSGSDQGVFIYMGSEAWGSSRFRPNIVVIQRAYDHRHDNDEDFYREILATDAGLADQLVEYRNIHLSWDTLGEDSAAVLRVSSYRNEEGTPLMLYQWNALRAGLEVNFAITFPTADYSVWADLAYAWAKDFEWTV